jgi:hypothetical protein
MFDAFNHPQAGPLVGRVAARLTGVDPRYMVWMDSADQAARAARLSIEELAREALEAKLVLHG